ncbi:MAG: HDOD domain-containing protein [Proteobacteria bacterium]|nr:HDOD domain-containing protein [Pseudomonadota bacterium]
MTASFLDSVKQAFASVFGHADIEHLLQDDWTFSDEVPIEARQALRRRPGYAKPVRDRKTAKRPKPGKRKPVDATRPMPKKLEALPDVDMDLFDGCEDEDQEETVKEPAGPQLVLLENDITVGRPHPSSEAEAEDTGDLFAGIGMGLHDPYPADFEDEEEAPARRDTLDITGNHGPASSGPVEFKLSSPIEQSVPEPAPREPVRLTEPAGPVLRLEPSGPAVPKPVPPAPDLEPEPHPVPEPSIKGVPAIVDSASGSISRRPTARTDRDNGTPPTSIWDERQLRDEIVADLAEEIAATGDEDHRRVITALMKEIDEDPLKMPPFPEAARRLLGEGGSAPTDEDLVEIVKSEPALAGNIVKVANSPFYMAATHVASVNAAVMRIGLDQVRRVALTTVVGSSYEVRGFSTTVARIRLHSYGAALAAETLAHGTDIDPAEAFLAGLLHDAGEVLAYYLVRNAIDVAKEAGGDFEPDRLQLRKLSRRYHPRLGALFLGGWDLAASVASAMAYHHHPAHAEARFADLVSLVHVADELAYRAIQHSSSADWRTSMRMREPGASRAELDKATAIDGIEFIDVDDLLFQAPRGASRERLHGVLRATLLRLDSSDQGSLDGGDALASTTL